MTPYDFIIIFVVSTWNFTNFFNKVEVQNAHSETLPLNFQVVQAETVILVVVVSKRCTALVGCSHACNIAKATRAFYRLLLQFHGRRRHRRRIEDDILHVLPVLYFYLCAHIQYRALCKICKYLLIYLGYFLMAFTPICIICLRNGFLPFVIHKVHARALIFLLMHRKLP